MKRSLLSAVIFVGLVSIAASKTLALLAHGLAFIGHWLTSTGQAKLRAFHSAPPEFADETPFNPPPKVHKVAGRKVIGISHDM